MQERIHVCPNGLTALVSRQSAHPVLSLQCWVGTGSIHEEEWAGAGISHLLEHMVFKGTKDYNAVQLNEEVAALGGSWNAYTSSDRTVFYIDGPAGHWRRFLHVLADLVFRPSFPVEEWEREREVIRREMAMCNDDPQDFTYRTLLSTLNTVHPRRLPVIGELPRFDALTHEDMLAYHRRRYVPSNIFFCLVGDVEEAAFFQALDEETADIPARPLAPVNLPAEPHRWGPRLRRAEFSQPTSTLMLAWPVPCSRHADSPALAVLLSLLGDGRSAWLYKRFHDELALVHDISAFALGSDDSDGHLVVEVDVERGDRDRVRDALLAYMAELPQVEPAAYAEALERVRRMHRLRRVRTEESVQKQAARLGVLWHRFRNPGADDEWEYALHAVQVQDLPRVAARYLASQNPVEVSVDPIGSNPASDAVAETAQSGAPQVLTLPQGLRLVLRQDHRLPLVNATLAFGAGCPSESVGTAGINNLMAECLLKGTPRYSATAFAEAVENLGASINCHAGNNTLTMDARCLAEDAPAVLALLADAALHPLFPQEDVETVKEDMVADILDAQEDPAAVAFRRLRWLCFGPVSYGNHPDGTVESVESLTREDLLAHHARLVCGRNAVLCVAGDIDPAAVQSIVEKLFEAMPVGSPLTGTPTPPHQAADVQVPCDKEQVVLALALPAPPVTSPDLPLLSLLDEWCRDMGGPIFTELREKRGLAYYASSATLLGVDTGCLYFYLGASPGRAAEARAALEEVLAGLAKEGMPPEALERTRATALAAQLLSAQSATRQCSATAVDALLGLGADYSDKAAERIQSVTHEQMQAFIRRILSPAAVRTWCTVGKVGG